MNNKVNDNTKSTNKEKLDFKGHWNNAYQNNPMEKLGWYETDLSPSFDLIKKSSINKNATILVAGAGNTILVDALLNDGYTDIIATDISNIALKALADRSPKKECLTCIVDDITAPTQLKKVDEIDLWIDRAVLHFFTEVKDQHSYFDLLKSKLKKGGHVLLAEFSLEGAKKCSGLPIVNYASDMFQAPLGEGFSLIETFDYTYTMPSGDKRPYIYALYQKN